jgi:hypothetical protein
MKLIVYRIGMFVNKETMSKFAITEPFLRLSQILRANEKESLKHCLIRCESSQEETNNVFR